MTAKTIAEKMYVKNANSIAVINGYARHAALLAELPPQLIDNSGKAADLVLLFVHSLSELETLLPDAKARLAEKGALWVAYIKGTSKQKSDVNRDIIASFAQTMGLDSVAIISIDVDWSALRLKRL